MPQPNFWILYVSNATHSAAFYADLLERPPVESSPGFAMFALDSGMMLGLWGRDGVTPAPSGLGGGAEIAFALGDDAELDAVHARWRQRGLEIVQAPVVLDFGYSFVALDPDAHRLRVFAPRRHD